MSGTSINATASIVAVQTSPGEYSYTITLNDTGNTTIGTFWFAWVPGQDFMSQDPTSIGSPGGWNEMVTTANYSGRTGYAIQWTAGTPGADLNSGGSSSAFTFNSTETPAQMAANSPFVSGTPTTTSFVYQGGPFVGASLQLTAPVACFREGTRIRTPLGDRPVEDLHVGDQVVTGSGETRPIVWTGRRRIECGLYADPRHVWPVRVAAGALGPMSPAADLWLSRDHALSLDGVLVPVKYLINGTTIRQTPVSTVTWHHLRLETHDVILAEGAAAETYFDRTGDRAEFDDGPQMTLSIPGSDRTRFLREAEMALPLVVSGPRLEAIRALLAVHAGHSLAA